jgi:hypothetical protein
LKICSREAGLAKAIGESVNEWRMTGESNRLGAKAKG